MKNRAVSISAGVAQSWKLPKCIKENWHTFYNDNIGNTRIAQSNCCQGKIPTHQSRPSVVNGPKCKVDSPSGTLQICGTFLFPALNIFMKWTAWWFKTANSQPIFTFNGRHFKNLFLRKVTLIPRSRYEVLN